MEASRELGIYAEAYGVMYLLCAVAALFFFRGLRQHALRWQRGSGPAPPPSGLSVGARVLRIFHELIEHRRLLRRRGGGTAHLMVVSGMIVFSIGTLSVMLQEHFGVAAFRGSYYLGLSLILDLFGLLSLAGIVFLLGRRRPHRQMNAETPVLFLAAFVPASGLFLEGVRMAQHPDPWGAWSPVGLSIAYGLTTLMPSIPPSAHRGVWWIHLLASLALFAAIPYSRLFHLLVAPANIFLSRPRSGAALLPLDFEKDGPFGTGRIEEWNWRELLAADACVECGRCEDACPAWKGGRPLSPLAAGSGLKRQLDGGEGGEGALLAAFGGEEALWSCTTCGGCDESCPAGIGHVSRTVDLRRHEVLMASRFPPSLQRVFRGLESQGNPWGMERGMRSEAAAHLGLPSISEEPEAELVLWIGCSGTYDPKTRDVLRRVATLLRNAGVRIARFDRPETCCGDPARRLGNEYLYQSLALENIDTLKECAGRTLVTACPHCYNTFAREYPQMGGAVEVLHYTELLAALLDEGRLKTGGDTAPGGKGVFHDPCYLARHNDVVTPPRRLLGKSRLSELDRSGRDTFCCGGGGGGMWMEGAPAGGTSRERGREIVDSGAESVYTACPFCRTMLSDALAGLGSTIAVRDVSESLSGTSGGTT